MHLHQVEGDLGEGWGSRVGLIFLIFFLLSSQLLCGKTVIK